MQKLSAITQKVILELARQGLNSVEIRTRLNDRRVDGDAIRRVCRAHGVEITLIKQGKPRKVREPLPQPDYAAMKVERESKRAALELASQHPLAKLREEYTADLEYALAVLKWDGRHSYVYAAGEKHDRIDGRPATPYLKMVEANRMLKREGFPQIGPAQCRS